MEEIEAGGTVTASIEITNASGTKVDPATSVKATFQLRYSPYTKTVDDQAMTKDATGEYHYDWNSSEADSPLGEYKVVYKAVDGSRVTKQTDYFKLIRGK